MEDTKFKRDAMRRLPKRLLYVLRYGVLKEGLDVDPNGFVDIKEVMKVPLLKQYTEEEILNVIKTSISFRHTNRYEWRETPGKVEVRAAYSRSFEPNPFHKGTQVKTLLESSMSTVLKNLDMFDLEEFQDEYLINLMIHRLKRDKTVTLKALSCLLVPTLTRVNLHGVYLTNNTLRLLYQQCPHLKDLNLNNSGYIVTDTVLIQIAKNLPHLEELNLTRCSHLTGQCLSILAKRLPRLKKLYLAGVPSITPKFVQPFLLNAKELTHLDVFFMKTSVEEFKSLMAVAKNSGAHLALDAPFQKDEGASNAINDDNFDDDDLETFDVNREGEYGDEDEDDDSDINYDNDDNDDDDGDGGNDDNDDDDDDDDDDGYSLS